MKPADLLLRWLSERSSGSWDSLRDIVKWIYRDYPPGGRWWIVLDHLADLAHIDIDRSAGTWSASPPVIDYLPPRSMFSVLCGSRTYELTRKLLKVASSRDGADIELQRIGQDDGPEVWMLAGTREATRSFANAVGVAFVDDSADSMSGRLGPIGSYIGKGSIVRGGAERLQKFDSQSLTYYSAERVDGAGLYKLTAASGPRFVYATEDGLYHDVDPRTGSYLELARMSHNVLRYSRGDLWAPLHAPLPDAQRRCLTLCSGFLPTRVGDFVRYQGIPAVVADNVSSSVNQLIPIGQPLKQGWAP